MQKCARFLLVFSVVPGQNLQSPIERGQLSQATLQFHKVLVTRKRMLHEQTPVARCESQHNDCRAYEHQALRLELEGRYDHQRAVVIRIKAITLASDSGQTIAQFRPSKFGLCVELANICWGLLRITMSVESVLKLVSFTILIVQGIFPKRPFWCQYPFLVRTVLEGWSPTELG